MKGFSYALLVLMCGCSIADGGSGKENITSDGRFEIFDSGELLIARALPQDTGMYTCNATNSMGHVSASAFVKVLGKCTCMYVHLLLFILS